MFGGDATIRGGNSNSLTSSLTGNVNLNPGSIACSGISCIPNSVTMRSRGESGFFFLGNEKFIDATVSNDMDLHAGNSLEIDSGNTMSITATNGISFGGSFLHGFEIAPEYLVSSSVLTINAQAGSFIVPEHGDYEQARDYMFYNSRVTSGSLFFSQVINSVGTQCWPLIRTAVCHDGYVTMNIYNYAGINCDDDATFAFFIIG